MRNLLVIRIIIGITTMTFTGCKKNSRDVVGNYLYTSSDIQISLNLDIGSTFVEEITIGNKKYKGTGTWSLEPSGEKLKLRSFLIPFDTRSDEIIEPPKRLLVCDMSLDPWKPGMFFDDESHDKYFLQKVKAK